MLYYRYHKQTDTGEIIQFACRADNYGYLLADRRSGRAVAIDTPDPLMVIALLEQKGWHLTYILNTHWHDDHVGGNVMLKEATGARVIAPEAERKRIPGIDVGIRDGAVIILGDLTIHAMETAGHTLGSLSYYVPKVDAVFSGDALFTMGCGRLFEGTPEMAWNGLLKLAALPAETRIYCAHEYGLANATFALSLDYHNDQEFSARAEAIQMRQNSPTVPSTIGLERRTNPFFSIPIKKSHIKEQVELYSILRDQKNNFGL
ncbi:hydroxyacylglutathione hydrolase [Sphingobium sp.]|uniref:hydroxyacylglutathione hydrolase n=1 Tax=Sphingobium sp. TaxID=1912891 RepID=UPI0028BE5768|nr:hydroxyacylglutathione hydrolase [Sphingobium sp.]